MYLTEPEAWREIAIALDNAELTYGLCLDVSALEQYEAIRPQVASRMIRRLRQTFRNDAGRRVYYWHDNVASRVVACELLACLAEGA